mmetsp:Transcript_12453/g.39882  ORF Transcript_12453/g.39882 Transcript_12453/m.39882 type:complete len:207 (-) Transcript_12453:888-1508(-)
MQKHILGGRRTRVPCGGRQEHVPGGRGARRAPVAGGGRLEDVLGRWGARRRRRRRAPGRRRRGRDRGHVRAGSGRRPDRGQARSRGVRNGHHGQAGGRRPRWQNDWRRIGLSNRGCHSGRYDRGADAGRVVRHLLLRSASRPRELARAQACRHRGPVLRQRRKKLGAYVGEGLHEGGDELADFLPRVEQLSEHLGVQLSHLDLRGL